MTWTALPAYSDGNALTAAQMTAIKDNINETVPAHASNAGSWFISTGPNAVVGRSIDADSVLTQQTTTSTSYVNLTTVGPTIGHSVGVSAIISISCQMFNSGSTSSNWSSYEVSGATTRVADDIHAISCEAASATQAFKMGATFLETLTAGFNTLTQKYRVGSNTGTFDDRHMVMMAL
jgi:hypothetical protein